MLLFLTVFYAIFRVILHGMHTETMQKTGYVMITYFLFHLHLTVTLTMHMYSAVQSLEVSIHKYRAELTEHILT